MIEVRRNSILIEMNITKCIVDTGWYGEMFVCQDLELTLTRKAL